MQSLQARSIHRSTVTLDPTCPLMKALEDEERGIEEVKVGEGEPLERAEAATRVTKTVRRSERTNDEFMLDKIGY